MSNVTELEIDGMKASELASLTKKSWVPFVAFMVLILMVGVFTVRLAVVASNIGASVMPKLEYPAEKQ